MNEARWIARALLAARRRDPEAFWSRFKRARVARWRATWPVMARAGNGGTGAVRRPWYVRLWRWVVTWRK